MCRCLQGWRCLPRSQPTLLMTRSNWEVEDGAELSLVNNTRLRMLDAPGKVANRVKSFPLCLTQIFLRCVALGHIELVIAKVLLLLADAELQRLDVSRHDAAHPVDRPSPKTLSPPRSRLAGSRFRPGALLT